MSMLFNSYLATQMILSWVMHFLAIFVLVFQDIPRPDLTIESVTFQWEKNLPSPGPVRSGDNRPFGVFTLIVRNVGTKDFQGPFYISFASRQEIGRASCRERV